MGSARINNEDLTVQVEESLGNRIVLIRGHPRQLGYHPVITDAILAKPTRPKERPEILLVAMDWRHIRLVIQRACAAIVIGACLQCVGCVSITEQAEEASVDQVREYVDSPMGRYSTLFSGVFYAGSDEEFDYIAVKHRKRTVKVFKTRLGEIKVRNRTKIDAAAKNWLDITDLFP